METEQWITWEYLHNNYIKSGSGFVSESFQPHRGDGLCQVKSHTVAIDCGEKLFACGQCEYRSARNRRPRQSYEKAHQWKIICLRALQQEIQIQLLFEQTFQIALRLKSHTLAASVIMAQKQDLENHAKLHEGEKPFRCDECNKTFNELNIYFEKHLKRVQFWENDYVNRVENDGAGQPTGEKPYRCSTVWQAIRFDFKFGGTSEDTRSREIISLHVVWSSVCPQSCLGTTYADAYRRKAIPMQHVWLSEYTEQSPHTAYDDSHGREEFKCDKCNKQFRHSSTLSKHFKIHAGVKPCACSACDYRSSQKMELGQSHAK